MGVIAGIFGIFGFLLSWVPIIGIPLGWIFGLVATILGALTVMRPPRPIGAIDMAFGVTGLTLGLITIVLKSIPMLRWL
ncbi:MAG: hypothetical protein OWS74_09225 [Firmicutes bacterium]|nr:hypothetical protein [Bacillota bacterium]